MQYSNLSTIDSFLSNSAQFYIATWFDIMASNKGLCFDDSFHKKKCSPYQKISPALELDYHENSFFRAIVNETVGISWDQKHCKIDPHYPPLHLVQCMCFFWKSPLSQLYHCLFAIYYAKYCHTVHQQHHLRTFHQPLLQIHMTAFQHSALES